MEGVTTPCLAHAPSNSTMWVYARSLALRHPELLPRCRFTKADTPHTKFLPSEQMLLAMALYLLQDVKHSNWKKSLGKYGLIALHFLPNKTGGWVNTGAARASPTE